MIHAQSKHLWALLQTLARRALPIKIEIAIRTIAAEKGPLFDLNANGIAEKTGWLAGNDDAFLVLDRDANGSIDNGSELFGDSSPLANGDSAVNGFEALAQFDLNHDDRIDAADSIYYELRLWLDANHDGISQSAELFDLSSKGVSFIKVTYQAVSEIDRNGNATLQRSFFGRQEAFGRRIHAIADIWFRTLNVTEQ